MDPEEQKTMVSMVNGNKFLLIFKHLSTFFMWPLNLVSFDVRLAFFSSDFFHSFCSDCCCGRCRRCCCYCYDFGFRNQETMDWPHFL